MRPADIHKQTMHLLYLDDSGSLADPLDSCFVPAGVSVFERKTHWIEERLNKIAARFDPADPYSVELHGSPMRTGQKFWRKHPLAERMTAMKDALREGVVMHNQGVVLFGVAIKRGYLEHGEDPVEYAFEQLSSRFDMYLMRMYRDQGDAQRGIIIIDKSSTEKRIQTLARDFKHSGHTWGRTRNYAQVPLFLDSRSSMLIQLADLVAYALHRYVGHGDDSLYQVISGNFDKDRGATHGLCLYPPME